jgi:hypothetical protein
MFQSIAILGGRVLVDLMNSVGAKQRGLGIDGCLGSMRAGEPQAHHPDHDQNETAHAGHIG